MPAFDRPLKVTIPGEEKKDAHGFKVVPSAEGEGEAGEAGEGGEGGGAGEKADQVDGRVDGHGVSDAGPHGDAAGHGDDEGDGESTMLDGESTVITTTSMVTDRSRLEGTIKGLSSEWLTLDEWHEEHAAAEYICAWIYHHRRRHRMQVMISGLHENRRVAICRLQAWWRKLTTQEVGKAIPHTQSSSRLAQH